jgi:hypothetical protein
MFKLVNISNKNKNEKQKMDTVLREIVLFEGS